MQQDKKEFKGSPAPLNVDAEKQQKKSITDLAHEQAENDIEEDADLNSKPAAEDGLDEGELARLEGED